MGRRAVEYIGLYTQHLRHVPNSRVQLPLVQHDRSCAIGTFVGLKPRSRLSAGQWQSVGREYSRIFYGIFEMPCAEWYTSAILSTVELKSKAFLAVDSRAW
eukprot:8087104-Pyramimonas_sp.AAC.1